MKQEDLTSTPISGSAAVPTAQIHHFHHDSFNSPYYPPSQNPNLNSNSNYNYVLSFCSNAASSNQPTHQIAQKPNAVVYQQYAMNPLLNTNPITGSQNRLQWKSIRKKIKAVQLFRCEVCKVDCNSESVLDLHYLGTKHKKNLQKLDIANSGDRLAWCEVCKIEFNSKTVLDSHNLGKKHKKNLDKLDVANSNVPPQAWCEVCQANYSSQIVLDQHKLGRKHKNIEKLIVAANTNTSAVAAPAIGPGENSGDATSTTMKQSRQKKEGGGSDDLETKKRKVLQEGAAPEAVCICPVCNVICNSIAVFKYHLAGKKHSAMMKKLASATGSTAAT